MVTKLRRRVLCASIVALVLSAIDAGSIAAADDDALLPAMEAQAAAVSVESSQGEKLPLLETPVFRYTDQPRRILDGTLWLWTDGRRPAALQKVEAIEQDNGSWWTICWASCSEDELQVGWPNGRGLKCSRPGVVFAELPDPPMVEEGQIRALHLRQVARRFTAQIVNDPQQNLVEQMRLLPRPIYEYADPDSGLLAGALFGFTCNGTNPDAYLVLEAQRDEEDNVQWRYGWVRMTSGGVKAQLGEETVWECEWVRPIPIPRENWMFFKLPRE